MMELFGRHGYAVTTRDGKRAATWLRIFGTDALPVLAPCARFQEHPGHPFGLLAYDLDLVALSPRQRERFAGYLHRRYGMNYSDARRELETCGTWPIKAGPDIVVLQPEEDPSSPAVFHWPRAGHLPSRRTGSPPEKSLAPAGLF